MTEPVDIYHQDEWLRLSYRYLRINPVFFDKLTAKLGFIIA